MIVRPQAGLEPATSSVTGRRSDRQLGITTSPNQFQRSVGGAFGVAFLGAVSASGPARFSAGSNALVNHAARAHMAPARPLHFRTRWKER
jgi:hypothetical protein